VIHGSRKISEEEVVLEEVSEGPRASRRLHLKVRPASKRQVPARESEHRRSTLQ
jgi:hypothetical protein